MKLVIVSAVSVADIAIVIVGWACESTEELEGEVDLVRRPHHACLATTQHTFMHVLEAEIESVPFAICIARWLYYVSALP